MEAFSLFDEMLSKRVEPHSYVYNSLLCGLCKEGDMERALKLFRESLFIFVILDLFLGIFPPLRSVDQCLIEVKLYDP